jgi:hypothetical protein
LFEPGRIRLLELAGVRTRQGALVRAARLTNRQSLW